MRFVTEGSKMLPDEVGAWAVQCIYMVSGFLISLVLSGKYDASTPAGLRLFYTNRALRIFVPYWTF